MKKKIHNFWLIIYSILFTLIILEIFFNLLLPKHYVNKYYKVIYRLWDQGKIFKNIDNFFKFEPNLSVRHEVFFDINNEFIKEYSYKIKTNNFGLVQDNDIYSGKPQFYF